MNGKPRKIQLRLAWAETDETQVPFANPGSEPPVADPDTARPTREEPLPFEATRLEVVMEGICNPRNIQRAMDKVIANAGGPGIDGMKVTDLPKFWERCGEDIRRQLLAGAYRPRPVKRVEIDKDGGGARNLGIPCVVDRLIQQAILQHLDPAWDLTFSPYSYGFRRCMSAHQAVTQASQYIAEGYTWMVDIDLEKFFDRVNHDVLMSRVARRVEDKRLLKLLRSFLTAGVVLPDGLTVASAEGTPQGGPLSPLLSNLLLDELDQELTRRGLRFVRYADDFCIFVASERAGLRVKTSITGFLEKKLRLRVNESKSAVDRVYRRSFLGFGFGAGGKILISRKAKEKFRKAVRLLTKRNRGNSLRRIVEELNRYLRGWKAYFGLASTPAVYEALDGWIRRRLRCYMWKQWKTGKRRYKELLRLRTPPDKARMLAGADAGPWRTSHVLGVVLRPLYFHRLGLFSLNG